MFRAQKLFAIERKNQFWNGSSCWVDDIKMAKILPERQAKTAIKITIGMYDCELVEIVPIKLER